jgi:hypothetical protein
MHRFLAAALLALMLPNPAEAGSLTVFNSTDLVAYQGSAPAAYFGGANPYVAQQAIGNDFTTTSLTLQAQQGTNGDVTVDFDYITQFSGSETTAGVTVSAADIFFQPAGGAQAGNGFTYGIALGDQAGNGGLAAGFYQVQSDATSQSIWSARGGFIYGGAVAPTASYEPGQPGYGALSIPTVITSGQLLGGASVAITEVSAGWYSVDASTTMSAQQAALFAQGIDVIWGTGDCGNGTFLAELPGLPISEPGSLILLVSALGWTSAVRRRRWI